MSLLGAAETTSTERQIKRVRVREHWTKNCVSRVLYFFWLNVFLKMSGGHARKKYTQLSLYICMYVCVYINTSICMYYLHMYEWEGEGKGRGSNVYTFWPVAWLVMAC